MATSSPPPHAVRQIKGRKWRRSDPRIPPQLRQELVNELMAARRAVGTAVNQRTMREARARVRDAKVALGERGPAWWDEPDRAALVVRISAAVKALLRSRRLDATICPSEAARIVDGDHWRRLLSIVRDRAADMAAAGEILILRKGVPVVDDCTVGTLRYRLAAPSQSFR